MLSERLFELFHSLFSVFFLPSLHLSVVLFFHALHRFLMLLILIYFTQVHLYDNCFLFIFFCPVSFPFLYTTQNVVLELFYSFFDPLHGEDSKRHFFFYFQVGFNSFASVYAELAYLQFFNTVSRNLQLFGFIMMSI